MSSTGYDLITEEMLQEALNRIEVLEKALREIVEVANDDVSDEMKLDRINIVGRAALDPASQSFAGHSKDVGQ